MNKTFEVVEAYIDNEEIHAFENGRRVLDIIMSEFYYIENIGCDDETCGLALIPDNILPWVKSIINNLNKNSQYGCMPTIEIYKINDSFVREATEDDNSCKILHMPLGKYVLTKDIRYYDRDAKEFKLTEGVEKIC